MMRRLLQGAEPIEDTLIGYVLVPKGHVDLSSRGTRSKKLAAAS